MTPAGDLDGAARRAVQAALDTGASDAEAWAERSAEREIRVYEGAVESLTDATSAGLGVRAFLDGRVGYAYGTDLGEDGARTLAAAAREAAEAADADEHGGLPEECGAAEVAGLASPALGDWDTRRKVDLAVAVEHSARARDGVSQVEETVYADTAGQVALANSRDFAATYEATAAWSWCSAFAGEGSELMTGIGVGIGRDPDALDPDAIGGEAADRALALVGARQPATRRCPVILDAFVAASFIGLIAGTLSAEAVQRGRSPFAEREGEEIASQALRVADDGVHPDGPSSAPFDGEGSPRRSTDLISGGRLETFLFDARSARRAGRATTGNAGRSSYRSPPSVAATNVVVEPGEDDLAGLARRAGEGLYVSDVVGLHSGVNPVSGTFSVGATGRLVQGGELATPVREATIAGDLGELLRAVEAVGSEARWVPFGGSVRAVPLLVRELAVSGE